MLRTTHRFYFLPSYEYPRVGNGTLIEFLHDEQDEHPNLQFVIVMEDAEAVLMPRKIDTGFSVSALLNLADGLLGEGLNLQFMCTVNCEIAELDAAIVRPGRLRTARDFRLLTHSEGRRQGRRPGTLIAEIAAAVSTRLLDDCCVGSTIADYLSRRWKISWPETQVPSASVALSR